MLNIIIQYGFTMEALPSPRNKKNIITYKNALLAVSMIFLGIGIFFYVIWSILYDTWLDPGIYAFCLPMALFGILGVGYIKSGAYDQ